MDNDKEKIKNWGWGSSITAGMIFVSANELYGSSVIILIIAIGSGLLFYRLKGRLKFLKYPALISFASFLILFCASAFILGLLGFEHHAQ